APGRARCRRPHARRSGPGGAARRRVASCVSLPDDMHFTGKRRLIRQALDDDGVAETIERLVDALLPV
ncbi:MAG: hypothetical protein ACK58O_03310, partial [Brevundimonas sp.]